MNKTIQKKKFEFPIWGWFFVFFGVLFIADGTMVYIAVTTWNGLSTENAYEHGLRYNQTISESEHQIAQGWKHDIVLDKTGNNLSLKVHIASPKYGNMTNDAIVSAKFFRTTQVGFDKTFLLKPTKISGQFAVNNFKLPLQGLWDIKVSSIYNGEIYRANKRMDIRW